MQYGDTMLLLGAQKRVPFDVLKAFDPVVGLSTQPYILLVHVNLAASSIKELVARLVDGALVAENELRRHAD